MNTILNWNDTDYQSIYLRQLRENPIWYDADLKLWVAYSYEYCKAILLSAGAHVPEPVTGEDSPLNSSARLLLRNMVRLSNGRRHDAARDAAMAIFQKIKKVDKGELLQRQLDEAGINGAFDWVEVVGKQLPVRLVLLGLGFNDPDTEYIAANLKDLVPIMSPNKTTADIARINPVAEVFSMIIEERLGQLGMLTGEAEADELIICNLIGLFIQSYDGGRGLLCNTLISLAAEPGQQCADFRNLVNETLRHNPPVHNTRRVAVNDLMIGDRQIKAGEGILVVLAAANLDSTVFAEPEKFDADRVNAGQNLTFGLGGHNCVAKYFCIDMAAEMCAFLQMNYPDFKILQNEFTYGPQLNVRLVEQLMVNLNKK